MKTLMFGDYKRNAFGRRIVRDYPCMPLGMRSLLIVSYSLDFARYVLQVLLMACALISIMLVVSGTWLVGGTGLISDSSALPWMGAFGVALLLNQWRILPILFYLAFSTWYHAKRHTFRPGQ